MILSVLTVSFFFEKEEELNAVFSQFKELADKVYASDMSIHKALQQTDSMASLPEIKQGSVAEANKLLNEFEINTTSTNELWMVSKTTTDKVLPDLAKPSPAKTIPAPENWDQTIAVVPGVIVPSVVIT